MSQPPIPPSGQPMPPDYSAGYTPQYTFWPQYLTPPDELLKPAKRAGILLIVMGVFTLLFAGCFGFALQNLPATAFEDALRQARQMNPEAGQLTPQFFKNTFTVFIVLIGVVGLLLILCGSLVRLGGIVMPILSLILLAGCGLVLLLMILTSLGGGLQSFVMALVIFGVPLVLGVIAGISLIQAIVAAPKITESRRQMQQLQAQQMAYYQQQMYQPPQQ